MYQVKLSKTELKELKRLKHKERDKKIFRRLQAICLRHQGKSNQEIADIIGVCKETVIDWVRIFEIKGLDSICQLNYEGRRSLRIDPYIKEIKKDIRKGTISTLAELQDLLAKKYSIEIEQSWLSRCCKKNSISLTRKHI